MELEKLKAEVLSKDIKTFYELKESKIIDEQDFQNLKNNEIFKLAN